MNSNTLKIKIPEQDREIIDIIEPDMKNGPWIAGGAPLQWYQGQELKHSDVDIFFRDEKQYQRFNDKITNRIAKSFDARTIRQIFSDYNTYSNYVSVYTIVETDNAKTISVGLKKTFKLQLIKCNYFSSPEEIMDHFDISVCQFVTDGKNLVVGEKTLEDVKNKRLRLLRSRPTVIKRVMKYWTYGYMPSQEEFDIINAMDDLPATYEKHEDYDNAF